ncbi:MAG: hypothetical protein AB7J63_19585, partial [Vicinamibacterales bacterium]
DRVLGRVLALREAVLQGDLAAAQGEHGRAAEAWAFAVRVFIDHFDDPAHKYHKLARPWYEAALQHLGLGWEQEVALAGRKGGLEHRHARSERLWVRDADEYERLLAYKARELAKGMRPAVFITDPDLLLPAASPVPVEAVPV